LFVQVLYHESDRVGRFLNQQVLDNRYEKRIYVLAVEVLLQLGLDIGSLSDMIGATKRGDNRQNIKVDHAVSRRT
jgi:UDP-galactopyranose mutase